MAKKKTQWKEDLYFAVKSAWQKLSKYYADVTSLAGMRLISPITHDSCWKLRSFRKWDKGMDIHPEDMASYITQYQKAFLKDVEYENGPKHQPLPVTKPDSIQINNLISSTLAARFGDSSYDPHAFSPDYEEYLMPTNVAETTPRRSDCDTHLVATVTPHLNLPPELYQNWRQSNLYLNDYVSDPRDICITFLLPDITGWWRQLEGTQSRYPELSNMARDILSIIPHEVGVEVRFYLGRDVIGWRQSSLPGERHPERS
jgi:hypothetical protein